MWRWSVLWVSLFVPVAASGANQAYQNFFFAACTNPTGALAARCAETPGGTGNLSGDSESSLNPSQTLSRGDAGIAASRASSEQARDRAERARKGEAPADAVRIGPFSLLINGRSMYEEADRTVDVDPARGYEADAWGFELGFDYRVNDRLVIGLLGVSESTDTEFDRERPGVNFTPQGDAGKIEADRLGVTAFASFDTSEHTYVEVSVGYIGSQNELTRNVVFQESGRVVPQTNVRTSADDVDGTDIFGSVRVGYAGNADAWTYGGYLGLFYAKSELDAFREEDLTGSGLALDVDDYERESVTGSIGLRVGRGFSFGGGAVLPELRVEFVHEIDSDVATSRTSLVLDASGNVYTLRPGDPDEDYVNVGAGLVFLLPNGWMPFIDYQTMLEVDDVEQWRITAGLRKEL